METIPSSSDERRLELPTEVATDPHALELGSVWFSSNKVRIMTRTGTGLDQNPAMWGEILAGIGENVARCLQHVAGASPTQTLALIKKSLDENWRTEIG